MTTAERIVLFIVIGFVFSAMVVSDVARHHQGPFIIINQK